MTAVRACRLHEAGDIQRCPGNAFRACRRYMSGRSLEKNTRQLFDVPQTPTGRALADPAAFSGHMVRGRRRPHRTVRGKRWFVTQRAPGTEPRCAEEVRYSWRGRSVVPARSSRTWQWVAPSVDEGGFRLPSSVKAWAARRKETASCKGAARNMPAWLRMRLSVSIAPLRVINGPRRRRSGRPSRTSRLPTLASAAYHADRSTNNGPADEACT